MGSGATLGAAVALGVGIAALVSASCAGDSTHANPSAAGSAAGGANVGGTESGGAPDDAGRTGAPIGMLCEPGATQACVGPGRCEGGQACEPDGASWGECDCGNGTGGSVGSAGSPAGGLPTGGSEASGGSSAGGSLVAGSGGDAGRAANGGRNQANGGGGDGEGGDGTSGAGGEGCVEAERPPNLLLVLDRSCSMTRDALSNVSEQMWGPAVDALVQVAVERASEIRFGLEVFPDGMDPISDCGQNPSGDIAVPVGPDGGTQVAALLLEARDDETHPIYPGEPCVTNTRSALVQASQQAALDDPDRASYVVLITDGEPYCNDRAEPDETNDVLINSVIADMLARGVPTFVVGFGPEAHIDPAALARYAASGGTTPSAERPYYDAANGEQLLASLRAIGSTIVPCR